MLRVGAGTSIRFFSSVVLIPVLASAFSFGENKPIDTATSAARVSAVQQITHDGLVKTGLLADGSHLFVTERRDTHRELLKFSMDGRKASAVESGFPNVRVLDANRGRLLVTRTQDAEFWSVPVKSGKPEKLAGVSGRDAAWSRDRKQLVFSKGSKLFIANGDGSTPHELFSAQGSIFAPRFSPDGKRIRFTIDSSSENGTAIWEVGSDGSNPHPLLAGWQKSSSACCGTWSADGRYYIFQVTQTSPTTLTTLWALPEGESKPQQLTAGPISFGNVSPANDNKRLWAIGVEPQGQPVKYDPNTGKFVSLLKGISATDLDFSADGKWVTYVSLPDATLWRCKTDGSDRLQLTKAPARTALPHWSPDGKQIAYVSMEPGKPWKIAIISAQGGTPHDMLREDRGQIDANWSADGARIMFGYLWNQKGRSIRVINLKTHEVTSIRGSEGLFSPRWSPDGRYIAALSSDFTKVMLYDFKTGKWTTWLEEPAGAFSYPTWSPDSQYVYFDDSVTDEESIRRVKVGENTTERVFKLEGIERYPGPFGLWSGRMADGSWMFIRDKSTQEVYELSVVLP